MPLSDLTWVETAFRSHADRVFRFIVRRGVGRIDAEDLTQQTFLGALSGRGNVAPREALPYLLGIADNKVKDFWTASTRQQRAVDSLAAELEAISRDIDRHEPQTSDEFPTNLSNQSAIHEAVARLSAIEQDAIRLAYFDDLSGKDAAQVLRVSHDNFRAILFRARKKLRTQLEASTPTDSVPSSLLDPKP